MKFRLLSIISVITLTFTTTVKAQNIGIKGGLNLSNQSVISDNNEAIFSNGFEKDFKAGYNIGLFFGYDFNKYVGLEVGAMLNSKGYEFNAIKEFAKQSTLTSLIVGATDYEANLTRDITSLDIPILLKGMIPVGKNGNIYAKIGPYIGINLTGEQVLALTRAGESLVSGGVNLQSLTNFVTQTSNTLAFDTNDDGALSFGSNPEDLERFDFGMQVGLGTEIYGFLIEANYQLGLTNLDNFENEKTFNHVIGISVGYNLNLNKLF